MNIDAMRVPKDLPANEQLAPSREIKEENTKVVARSMVEQLRILREQAREKDLKMLAYLLDMAFLEAVDVIEDKN